MKPIKVAFFAEGATLAHVVRPLTLARALVATGFAVSVCRPASSAWLTAAAGVAAVDLDCQPPAVFARRLKAGRPIYDLATLQRYVDADLELIDRLQPDVVIGDFRLSLSVSARLRGVPYMTICDAYWSPECPLEAPLPVVAVTPYLPLALVEAVFRRSWPLLMRWHAGPMEALRRRYGMSSFGHDLRLCYTDADLRLFANFPRLLTNIRPSAAAVYVGPLSWFPPAAADADLASSRGHVYLTMGSSGDPRLLKALIPAIEATGSALIVATAGKKDAIGARAATTRVFDFVPGDLVCSHASLVICNGGSPTTAQALAHGVPVLGIAENMDQFLNMRTIEAYGAGLLVRADRASASALRAAIDALLGDRRFADRAAELASRFSPEDASTVVAEQIIAHCRRR